MIEIMMLVLAISISTIYTGMFWQPQFSSDYSVSSHGCSGKHMPYTSRDEPAMMAHNHLVISTRYSDLKKLKELSYLYKGTETGEEIYKIRRKRILDEKKNIQENIHDLNKKKQLLKTLKEISIEDIDKKKLDEINIYDLEKIVRHF